MEESKMVLRTEDLVKKYGKRTVVSHVSINVIPTIINIFFISYLTFTSNIISENICLFTCL